MILSFFNMKIKANHQRHHHCYQCHYQQYLMSITFIVVILMSITFIIVISINVIMNATDTVIAIIIIITANIFISALVSFL